MSEVVIAAAQRFSDAVAACEHWRVRDAYPHERWKAAWTERQAAMSKLMAAAQTLKPVDPKP